jgi:hypothetical protein
VDDRTRRTLRRLEALRRLAAPGSGATDDERNVAQLKIAELEATLPPGTETSGDFFTPRDPLGTDWRAEAYAVTMADFGRYGAGIEVTGRTWQEAVMMFAIEIARRKGSRAKRKRLHAYENRGKQWMRNSTKPVLKD